MKTKQKDDFELKQNDAQCVGQFSRSLVVNRKYFPFKLALVVASKYMVDNFKSAPSLTVYSSYVDIQAHVFVTQLSFCRNQLDIFSKLFPFFFLENCRLTCDTILKIKSY